MAEVYISGEIEAAHNFGDNRLCCYWRLQIGGGWRVVEGEVEGQTQTDLPSCFEKAYFVHPLDIHLATKTMQGWPRLHFQMWHFDTYGRQEPCGYGSAFVPSSPGEHEVVCHLWRPMGSTREEMMHNFVGARRNAHVGGPGETFKNQYSLYGRVETASEYNNSSF